MEVENKNQKKKKINILLLIWILVILFARFINSEDISDMFGIYYFSNYGFNYGSIASFIGYNFLWLLPLIILIINFILKIKKK